MISWNTATVRCTAEEVEELKVQLRALGYCYSLEKNPDGRFTFHCPARADLAKGTIAPQ